MSSFLFKNPTENGTSLLTGVNTNWSATSVSPPPPFDPSLFDYVFYMEDLSYFQQKWTDDRAFLPTTITYSLTFVLGVIGNILVVVSLLDDLKSRTVTSLFLVSLALADIVFLIVCVPLEIVAKLAYVWSGGKAFCKLAGFVEMLSASGSVLNLTAVSIERHVVIVYPLKSRTWCTFGRTKKIIGGVWMLAVLISSPVLHVMDTRDGLYYNRDSHVTLMSCADSNVTSEGRIIFAWYQLIVMFALPVLVIAYCYVVVIVILWLSTKELDQLTGSQRKAHTSSQKSAHLGTQAGAHANGRVAEEKDAVDNCHPSKRVPEGREAVDSCPQSRELLNRKKSNKDFSAKQNADVCNARIQVIKLLLVIILVFFVCWGPKLVLNVLKRHQWTLLHSDEAFYIMLTIHLLPYVQSSVNPIIYCFMSKNFRRSVRSFLRRIRAGCCGCLFGGCCCPSAGLPEAQKLVVVATNADRYQGIDSFAMKTFKHDQQQASATCIVSIEAASEF